MVQNFIKTRTVISQKTAKNLYIFIHDKKSLNPFWGVGGGVGGWWWWWRGGKPIKINPHYCSEGRRQGSGAVFLGEMEVIGKYFHFFASLKFGPHSPWTPDTVYQYQVLLLAKSCFFYSKNPRFLKTSEVSENVFSL